MHILVVSFFFSSRRRHTRFDCDWSSDVCSSICALADVRSVHVAAEVAGPESTPRFFAGGRDRDAAEHRPQRSEERRVGKESRSWGEAVHSKKKNKIMQGCIAAGQFARYHT